MTTRWCRCSIPFQRQRVKKKSNIAGIPWNFIVNGHVEQMTPTPRTHDEKKQQKEQSVNESFAI